MTGLEEVLRRAAADLDAVGAKWAIIVHRMSVRGYAVGMMLEQDYVCTAWPRSA